MECKIDKTYGTRLHDQKLHPRRAQQTIPAKFRDDQDIATQINTLAYEDFDLKDYAKYMCQYTLNSGYWIPPTL